MLILDRPSPGHSLHIAMDSGAPQQPLPEWTAERDMEPGLAVGDAGAGE